MNDSMETIEAKTILYRPKFYYGQEGRNGTFLLIDPEGPNWIGADARGVEVLSLLDGSNTFGDVVRCYSTRHNSIDLSEAWLHVHTFTKDALRHGFLSTSPFNREPYKGRNAHLKLDKLNALWIHTNNSCNLSCAHCLVDSAPSGEKGLPAEKILHTIDEARNLGVRQFYFTGGEPLLRQDFFELTEHALADEDARLIILTNGTLLDNHRLQRLQKLPASRLHLQISLDGSCPETNDPIRGSGSFPKIVAGIKKSVKAGLNTTVSTVVTSQNVDDIPQIIKLLPSDLIRGSGSFPKIVAGIKKSVKAGLNTTVSTVVTSQNVDDIPQIIKLLPSLGVRSHHLLFLHHRGRALKDGRFCQPVPIPKLIESIKDAEKIGLDTVITVDNLSFIRVRVDSPKFTRYDLSNACWDSLCLYSNGEVYPSAALAGLHGLTCG